MGKTLEKIAYTIMERYTNFVHNDDEVLDIEIVYDKIHDVRIFLMNREIDRRKRLSQAYYTICDCVEVKCGPVTCGEHDSEVVRYYADLSFVEESLGKYAISYLGTPDFKTPYRRVNFPFGYAGQYTRHKPSYSFVDGKAIFKGEPDFKLFSLISITKNGSCSLDSCDVRKPYNIPGDLIDELEEIIFKKLTNSYQIKRDEKNNTSDDV
jgi:hypothetical protein